MSLPPRSNRLPPNAPPIAVQAVLAPRAPGLPMQRLPGRAPPEAAWPRVSVVIPALNEARNLPPLLAELPRDLFEVIVVDGNSTDGTAQAAIAALPTCRILTQPGRGKGDALVHGFKHARGDIIITLDADGSADPAEFPLLVGALLAGADFAKGSRNAVGGGSVDFTRARSMGNRALGAVMNLLYGTRYTDINYGYTAFWRSCLPRLAVDCNGFEVEALMMARVAKLRLRVSEVPSLERRRQHGASNLRAVRDGWRVLRAILRERWAPGLPAPPQATALPEESEVVVPSGPSSR